jgi:hypothetical protein
MQPEAREKRKKIRKILQERKKAVPLRPQKNARKGSVL